jgi:hypothetical protein
MNPYQRHAALNADPTQRKLLTLIREAPVVDRTPIADPWLDSASQVPDQRTWVDHEDIVASTRPAPVEPTPDPATQAPAAAAYPEYDLIGNPGQTLSEVPLGGYVRKTAEDWGLSPDNALLTERIAAGGAGLLTAGVGVSALIAALQELFGNDRQVTY